MKALEKKIETCWFVAGGAGVLEAKKFLYPLLRVEINLVLNWSSVKMKLPINTCFSLLDL